jgi:hypothetical protein
MYGITFIQNINSHIIIISKVQYFTFINLSMRINIHIYIFLPMSYNFLIFYHVNSFLQLSFNSTNICGFKVYNTKKKPWQQMWHLLWWFQSV